MAFLKDITLGQYYHGESFLHRLDPRSKLLASLILMTSLLFSNTIDLILIHGAVILLAVFVSKIPFSVIAKNLKWFLWLFIITLAIHILEIKIVASFPYLNCGISANGLANGLTYTLRLALLIILAALLTLTTSPIELADGAERMFSPLKRLKLPVQEFALMMTLSLRFIPILIREAERIKNAQLSRGASLDGSLLERVKNIVPMILPLFVSAIRRADDLAVAMSARAYVGGEGRSSYSRLVFKVADAGVLIFSAAFMLGIFVLK